MRMIIWLLFASLLTGCHSTVQELRQAPVDRTITVQAAAEPLAACVHYRAPESEPNYRYQLSHDGSTAVLLATRTTDFLTQQTMAALELRFLEQGPKTTIEIREGNLAGAYLSKHVMPIIETCSHPATSAPGVGTPPQSAAPTSARPSAP